MKRVRKFHTLPAFLAMMRARKRGDTAGAERMKELFDQQVKSQKRQNRTLRGRPSSLSGWGTQ